MQAVKGYTFSLNIEPVTFLCNGKRLFGNLHLPYKGAPCIVTLHGLDSGKDSGKWPVIADRLFEEGYACLRFNFRGCGKMPEKSDGLFEETSLTSRIADYRAALQFLEESGKIDVNRVGVVGSSFGGMVAIAAREERVKAMVVMAAPYKAIRLGKPVSFRKEGIYYELEPGRRLSREFYKDLCRYNLLEEVKKAPPILILHGSNDKLVPVEHAFKLYEAASQPKKLEIINGANHFFSNREHLEKVISLSIMWFKKYLPQEC